MNAARLKGVRAERELAGLLSTLGGWRVRRRLQEGRMDDTGDLEGVPFTCIQVKSYADVQRAIRDGLLDLDRQQLACDAPYGLLFVRRRGGEWLAVTTADRAVHLIEDAAKWRGVLDGRGLLPPLENGGHDDQ